VSLARDLASQLDPVQLALRVGMTPHPWQVDALRSRASRALWLCARQVGKTTTAAIIALHCALYRPGSTVVIASPSQRQSIETFQKVAGFYRQLGKPVAAVGENLSSLSLESGSRVISVPGGTGGDTIRGLTVDLAILDEASRLEDALFEAVVPMIGVSDGRLLMLSTPAGRRGVFFDLWERGGTSWERVRVPASASPLWTPRRLEQQLQLLGDYAYRQEFDLAFVSDETQVFPQELLEAALTDAVKPLWEDS
jgi:hypothetical protein